jgi:methylenetetrahydrofolate reductase (NADPH)
LSRFAQALKSNKFVITTELNPPKGTDVAPLLRKAEMLKGVVDAFNLTDSHSSRMTMSPMAVAHLLLDRGVEPILQLTCRDRNRIALQSDLLGAYALGISNVVCMSGDHPSAGDHPDAKPVFDLDAIALLRAIKSLESGVDMGGSQLRGAPSFCVGAVANPGAPDLGKELRRMEEKIEAGASFFQTQTVYDPAAFERFMNAAQGYNAPIIAGFIMLKSADMARNFIAHLPGVSIPEGIIQELAEAESPVQKSMEIASRIIGEIRPMCQGIHIMAIGWESRIAQVLEAAGVT